MTGLRPFAILALLFAAGPAQAQSAASDESIARALTAWIGLPVAPGRDREVGAMLERSFPGWRVDATGNLVRSTGSGRPRRIVACALDIPQYVVSDVTDDGFIRLHRAGFSPVHPLWDQFHEAQRVKVLTRTGQRAGVVAVANGHFSRQHVADTTVVWVDELWVDVGAQSATDVAALGIMMLDPVIADRPAWEYEGHAAGQAAGARASCAAVMAASRAKPASGETIWVLSQQRAFGWIGLRGVLARIGRVDSITMVDAGRAVARDTIFPAQPIAFRSVVSSIPGRVTRVIAPRVRFRGSFVESIHASDARVLLNQVADAGGVKASGAWPAPPLDTALVLSKRVDNYTDIERTFMTLADIAGVRGHEHDVRDAILRELPAWARERAVIDSIGNLIVAAGPDRDSVLFMAHMDEVGFDVGRISRDGIVTLRIQGGPVLSTWEGQTALLHFDPAASGSRPAPLRGVFIPRDSARVKRPGTLTAWFGMDSAQLVARGVRPGLAVTSYKRADRLAGTRITGRGSDDRTGSSALIHAARTIDPSKLSRKLILAWSVMEEGGLVGATYFAQSHGASLARVYSIDTFVSSESPLERKTFAFTPLGRGFVMRGLDDLAMAPLTEMQRVERVAHANNIPMQTGTTQGGTDGSAMTAYGAPNVGLSWPGRYSHSPGEVLDLNDLDALIRIVRALAMER